MRLCTLLCHLMFAFVLVVARCPGSFRHLWVTRIRKEGIWPGGMDFVGLGRWNQSVLVWHSLVRSLPSATFWLTFPL